MSRRRSNRRDEHQVNPDTHNTCDVACCPGRAREFKHRCRRKRRYEWCHNLQSVKAILCLVSVLLLCRHCTLQASTIYIGLIKSIHQFLTPLLKTRTSCHQLNSIIKHLNLSQFLVGVDAIGRQALHIFQYTRLFLSLFKAELSRRICWYSKCCRAEMWVENRHKNHQIRSQWQELVAWRWSFC